MDETLLGEVREERVLELAGWEKRKGGGEEAGEVSELKSGH